MNLALEDITVLDLTRARSGPTCVRQLADWGANVICLEAPASAGEPMTDWKGSDYQNLHRNKRSLAMDLKSEASREVLRRLLLSADVVVENMRPSVKHRLCVDYESARAINPRIVYGSISGYGQDGPYSDWGSIDQIAQGFGGLMSVTGTPESGPMRVGIPISDLAAGLYLAVGILVALHERERSGEGQWVTTSLLESMIAMLDFQATRWTVDHEVPEPQGNNHPTIVPMGCFATADGYVNLGAFGRLWSQLCYVLGEPRFDQDPRFESAADRVANRELLNQLVAERLQQKSTDEWVVALNKCGVPAGPVYTIDQVFADQQVRHLGVEATVNSPELGDLSLIRNAVSMSRSSNALRNAAPSPGHHNTEILTELGLSVEEIDQLAALNAI